MNRWIKATFPILLMTLTACAVDGPNGGDGAPSPGAPTAAQALAVAEALELGHPADAAVLRRAWEIEVEFDTADHDAVVAFYDDWLRNVEGFERISVDEDDDEFEATYRDASRNLRAELEIDDEDGDDGVEVDFDLADPTPYAAGEVPAAFSGTSFGTSDGVLEFPFFDRTLLDEIEWDFEIVYDRASTSEAEAFAYFDAALVDLGWIRTDRDDDEEAEYRKDDVELELEVDDEDDGIEVEIELDKDRFY